MATILTGGRVFDPRTGQDSPQDVRIEDGRIAAVGPRLEVPPTATELRLRGALITPGLIDLHVHAYPGATTLGVEPDSVGVQAGVPTIVDVGSTGAYSFEGFRRFVVEWAATRMFAFLNFSATGILKSSLAELGSPAHLDGAAALRVIHEHRDLIRGIKVRATRAATGPMGIDAIRQARQVAREAEVPLLIHVGEPRGVPEDTDTLTAAALDLLDPGDIVTHGLTARVGGLFDRQTQLIPQARAALERGVRFEVGHGSNNVSYPLLRAAREQGLQFDAISSDVNTGNTNQRVFNLPIVLSKFVAAGVPLAEVLTGATLGPARLLGLPEPLVEVGAPADLSVLELLEGEWSFVDSEGELATSNILISPIMAFRAGHLHPSLSSRLYPTDRYVA
jgi:dihydroorotase